MIACFIGHRNIDNKDEIKQKALEVVSTLISQGVDTFLFGSRSDFDYICWSVVAELQVQFPSIQRIKYNIPHEVAFTSKEERERYENLYFQIAHKEAHFTDYEKSVDSEKSFNANKTTYIMRNQEMIDNCDICVFYYNKNYLPPKRKMYKGDILDYQPKSGTAIAYNYAKRKKKRLINLYND